MSSYRTKSGHPTCGKIATRIGTVVRLVAGQLAVEHRIDRDAVAVCQPVGLVRHANDGHQLPEHLVAHARLARCRAVARDAIAATVGDAYREVDHFLEERVERAWRHHLFDAFPGALEASRVVSEILPEVIDVW